MYEEAAALRYGSVFAELIKFTRGTDEYRYTTQAEAVEFGGQIYRPDRSIKIGSFSLEGTLQQSQELEVRVSQSHPIAVMYRKFFPSQTVSVTIYAGFLNDPDMDFKQVWKGHVSSCRYTEDPEARIKEANLVCSPRLSVLSLKGIPYRYSSICQHTVYQGGCRLNLEANTFEVTVSSVSGTLITLEDLPGTPTDFIAGLIRTGEGEWRDVLNQAGNAVDVNYPFDSIGPGDELYISRGCIRTLARCMELGNQRNILKFDVPGSNVFLTGFGNNMI